MNKTVSECQQRYRQKIASGDKTRLQVILESEGATKQEEISASGGGSQAVFVRQTIKFWCKK